MRTTPIAAVGATAGAAATAAHFGAQLSAFAAVEVARAFTCRRKGHYPVLINDGHTGVLCRRCLKTGREVNGSFRWVRA